MPSLMPSLKLISSPRRDVWTMQEEGPKHLTIAYIPLILSSVEVVKPLADAELTKQSIAIYVLPCISLYQNIS